MVPGHSQSQKIVLHRQISPMQLWSIPQTFITLRSTLRGRRSPLTSSQCVSCSTQGRSNSCQASPIRLLPPASPFSSPTDAGVSPLQPHQVLLSHPSATVRPNSQGGDRPSPLTKRARADRPASAPQPIRGHPISRHPGGRLGESGLPPSLSPHSVLRAPFDRGSQASSAETAPEEKITLRQPQRVAGARGQERPLQLRPRKARSGRFTR
ncbi:hypothetical protein NDU88_009218 [Pleurodeles waltl]|uniref:Uncharacterized protein n=1 Tax=Pleurodeles waltl TaxID=8319 RepID=A0AAV7RZ41_PLEWA|nr:hypothetical protein NDU88_009218 [Pleurodeles waltl]